MKSIIRRKRVQGLCWCFNFRNSIKNERIVEGSGGQIDFSSMYCIITYSSPWSTSPAPCQVARESERSSVHILDNYLDKPQVLLWSEDIWCALICVLQACNFLPTFWKLGLLLFCYLALVSVITSCSGLSWVVGVHWLWIYLTADHS